MNIYEVIWYDAHFNGAVIKRKNIEKQTLPYIIRTVGYYIGENEIDFKIAQEVHKSNNNFGHIMSIPHKMIIKKKVLK